jgi:hypothetical protein
VRYVEPRQLRHEQKQGDTIVVVHDDDDTCNMMLTLMN